MASRSCAQQSLCNNLSTDFTEEQDKFAKPQSLARRFNASSNKAFTPLKAFTLSLIPLIKDLFAKLMKAFVESTQV